MVFRRFDTSIVSYTSLPVLVDTLSLSLVYPFPNPGSWCNRIDFYVGNVSDHPLHNLHLFFSHNNWTSDRTWKYDVVVAVGYNQRSNTIVDIPTSLFPWCIDFFGATDIDMPMPANMVSDHRFLAACLECFRLKRRCDLNRHGACNKCRYTPCLPQTEKEIDSHHASLLNVMMKNRHALCPALSHLLATVGNANGYTKIYSADEIATLGTLIPVTGRDIAKEEFIRTKSASTQLVQFRNGKLIIVEEVNARDRMKFMCTDKRGKAALAINMPTFGIDNPVKAYSLLNSALRTPGHFYFANEVLWTTSFQLCTARIILVAQYESSDSLWIMVGWMI